jgi:uncharacterized protein GlcG (DUF336 family)
MKRIIRVPKPSFCHSVVVRIGKAWKAFAVARRSRGLFMRFASITSVMTRSPIIIIIGGFSLEAISPEVEGASGVSWEKMEADATSRAT